MATGFSFIRSQRGKNKLVSEGYIYKVDRVHGEKSYWVCHLPDCKGRSIQFHLSSVNIKTLNIRIRIKTIYFISVTIDTKRRHDTCTCIFVY